MIEAPGVAEVWAVLPEARIAGGAIRDFLARRTVADVDFAVPLPPDEVMARLRRAGLKAVPTGLAHGTVTAVTAGRGFEVTTLRCDRQTDGRHATVEFTDDWQADAGRRDFTINAMYADRDGEIYDYFGGRGDLAAGRVRFVGDAAARVTEDFLRILRFFRFYAGFGQGAADAAAIAAITTLKSGLARLSVERVWRELSGLLAVDAPLPAVRLMAATGVLPEVAAGADVRRLAALLERRAPADPLLRLAALLGPDALVFAVEKRLSLAQQDWLQKLFAAPALDPGVDDAALRRALADEPGDILLARTWLAPDGRPDWAGLRTRIERMPRPDLPLRGRDLLALGVEAGPQLGRLLARVRAWWLQGGCVADAAACLAHAKDLSRFR